MTTDFIKSFQVREYECDAYGHLNNANYVRYLHETTLEALNGMGVLPARSEPAKRIWYPRELFVDYLQPTYFGESLQVQATPVLQDGHRLVWEYEVRKEPAADVLVRAQLTYGIMDQKGGEWQPIPQDQIGISDSAKPFDAGFPRLPPPPTGGPFTRPWFVQWRDVSSDGVVQVSAYLDYLLDFVLQAAAACGWTYQHAMGEGYAAVVRRKWLKIFRPVRYGDELRLSTWLSSLRRSSVTRHFIIDRLPGEEQIGEAHTLWVGVDLQTGRPVRIPETWEQDFRSQISYG
jgi:acyl-CoA thioester hydrolase